MLARTFDDLFRRFESELTDLFGGDDKGRFGQWAMLPPMEVLRTDSEMIVRVELPGVDEDSIDVTLQDDVLRVRAERRVSTDEQGEYLRRGFAYGTFEGTVLVPSGVDPDRLSARYEGGILEIRVPCEGPKALKVPVQVGSGEKK
jgi:HSP20 family protein